MGKLIIKRKKKYLSFNNYLTIVIDGIETDKIYSGQTLYCNFADQINHSIFIKIKYSKSPVINFKGDNETIIEAETGNNHLYFYIILMLILFIFQSLSHKHEYFVYEIVAFILLNVLNVIMLIVGRKNYITLKEI